MARLPSTFPQAKVGVNLTRLNPASYDPAPATTALVSAFERGFITADQVMSRVQKTREEQARNKVLDAEEQLIPIRAARDRAQLEGDLEIIPRKTAYDRARFDSEIELIPQRKQWDIDSASRRKTMDDLEIDSASRRKTMDDLEIESRKRSAAREEADPEGVSKQTVTEYFKTFGRVLRDGAGKPDVARMGMALEELAKEDLQAKRDERDYVKTTRARDEQEYAERLSPTQKQGIELLGARAFGADGKVLGDPAMAAAMKDFADNPPAKPLTTKEQVEVKDALTSAQGFVRDARSALKLLFKTNQDGSVRRGSDGSPVKGDLDLVGFVRGSAAAPIIAGVESLWDGRRKAGQEQLRQLRNNLVAQKTKLLSGPLSEKELRFINFTVPDLNAEESTWADFLEKTLPAMEEMIANKEAALNAGSSPTVTRSGGPTRVSSVAEARALPSGTAFVLPDGTSGTVP